MYVGMCARWNVGRDNGYYRCRIVRSSASESFVDIVFERIPRRWGARAHNGGWADDLFFDKFWTRLAKASRVGCLSNVTDTPPTQERTSRP